jgi:hypothetical protein
MQMIVRSILPHRRFVDLVMIQTAFFSFAKFAASIIATDKTFRSV